MTSQKTDDVNLEHIVVTFAQIWISLRKRFVLRETPALSHTIRWRNFTIHKCTRLNSVRAIQVALKRVSMETFVPLLIMSLKFLSTWLSFMIGMLTSICTISKPLGALIKKKITSEKYVFMRITGRISAESHTFTLTRHNSVELGTLQTKLLSIKTLVAMVYIVLTLMGGRSLNFTLIFTRDTHVKHKIVKTYTVQSFTSL